MTHAVNKGKEGEREVRALFRNALEGIIPDTEVIKRNHQQAECGGADLVGVPYLSVEVKRVKKIVWGKGLWDWWEQCVEQCSTLERPCLVFRQDFGKWLVMYETSPVMILNPERMVFPTIMLWADFEVFLKHALQRDARRTL